MVALQNEISGNFDVHMIEKIMTINYVQYVPSCGCVLSFSVGVSLHGCTVVI